MITSVYIILSTDDLDKLKNGEQITVELDYDPAKPPVCEVTLRFEEG